jgi:membrane protein
MGPAKRFQDWLQGGRHRLEDARTTSPAVGFAFDAFSYDTDTGAPVLAAALGFRVFLFQVPYALVFVIIAGFVADMTGRDVESFFHGRGVTHLTAQGVKTAADLSGWARVSALLLALYALVLTARSLVKVINIVHALVWGVKRVHLVHATRVALVFIALVTVLLAVSIVVSPVRQQNALATVIVLLLYTIFPFVVWWLVSWRFPHQPCPPIALAPGAALFAVGVEILHVVTVVWFPHYVESKSEVYGTIGLAIVLLLWAYLLGRVITLAAVLNAALWARFGSEVVAWPRWHVPLFDDVFGRVWTFFLGEPPVPPRVEGSSDG